MSVGALGSATADVDGRGVVAPRGLSFELACWVGADDGWRCGDEGDAARQSRVGIAPVLATTLRVPDGEAVERVWGVPDGGGLIVVEVENRSAAAIAVAFVLRPVSGGLLRALEVRDSVIVVDGQPAVLLPRAPRTWVVAPQGRGGTRAQIVAGDTSEGVFPGHSDRRGVEGAFVFPVPHRTSVRAVILLDPRRAAAQTGAPALPDAEVAARGWRAHLERGLRTDLPDDALQHAVDASRATLLLEASSRRRCTPDVVAALEDWGFDPEAEAAWRRLRMSDRRAASRRPGRSPDPWRRIDALLSEASPTITFPGGPAPFLRAVREALVDETGESVDLLPGFPPEWLGRDLAVHGVPVAGGDVSFALRWHGERPALLWEGPDALGLTASALDPGFAAPGVVGRRSWPAFQSHRAPERAPRA
ncbi:MAG: hypothetical protein M5T61_13780 [Acidimicrobiia bacterium]|nr:hypothetical protein [Acidimicrobiia bacterium]